MPQIVLYKGRQYRQLWAGQTKHGPRAHLQFLNGSKDFWVSADLVEPLNQDTECPHCGRPYPQVAAN